jgi:hypothetical protein
MELEQRVRTAAVAGWWTLLIGMLVVWAQWIFYVNISAHPTFMSPLMGQGTDWPQVQNIFLWAIVASKLLLWFFALIVIWLTLWSRQLRKRAAVEVSIDKHNETCIMATRAT